MKAHSHYPPRQSVIHGPNPKLCAGPGKGHRVVPSSPSRCCSAFVHTPTSAISLDSRCSALGPEPVALHNGQAIDSGRHAAAFHRSHHYSLSVVGGSLQGGACRGTCFGCWHRPHSAYVVLPSYACWCEVVLAAGRRALTCSPCLPRPPPSKTTREARP